MRTTGEAQTPAKTPNRYLGRPRRHQNALADALHGGAPFLDRREANSYKRWRRGETRALTRRITRHKQRACQAR